MLLLGKKDTETSRVKAKSLERAVTLAGGEMLLGTLQVTPGTSQGGPYLCVSWFQHRAGPGEVLLNCCIGIPWPG